MKHVLISELIRNTVMLKADLDEALKLAEEAKERGEGLSIGLVGNAVDIHQAILEKGFKIDIITDNKCT